MVDERFDYAFAGSGLAALSLARALVESELPPGRIALIDRRDAPVDRTIGAWLDERSDERPDERPAWLEGVVEREWSKLAVATRAGERELEAPLRYVALHGARFHEQVGARLDASAWTIVKVQGEVEGVASIGDRVELRLRGRAPVQARWAFDSRVVFQRPPSWQSFVAARVELAHDHFDPARMLFMDLRLGQPGGGLEFGHVLPFGPREAMIYRVHVGARAREVEGLDDYLRALAIGEPRLLACERGCLPLDARPPTRRPSRRVLRIGVAGGRLQAGTGYAFTRMQRDAAAIVGSLVRRGHPFALPRERRVFRMLDGVLLSIVARRPELGLRMFEAMWRPGHDARLFRLLDTRASWLDLLGVMAAMPARLRLAGEGLRWLLGRPDRPALPPG
ncbi:lycopene cyclase family protein [Nannocystaceae bacterium ST9]